MPFFTKKKKAEEEASKEAEKAEKDEKSKKKKEDEKKDVDKEEEEESESGSETGSSDDEETEKTESKDKAESKEESKKDKEKSEDEGSESGSESGSGSETGDESGQESGPDETEPVSVTEDITTAQDATMDMSAAPTDLGDTINTTGELPQDGEPEDLSDQFEVIDDFTAEQDGDLTVTAGEQLTILNMYDDGWWEAENENGDRGLVPSSYLKQIEPPKSPSSPSGRSGKLLWGSLKKAVKQTTTTDVLHMMGSVPSGFRREYLKTKSENYTAESFLTPKLSTSNLYFNDLLYSPANGKVRSRPSQWCRTIQLNEFRNIPLPGVGTQVTKRCVRICLHDGEKVCSNIVKIEAQCVDKEEKIWAFHHKESDMIQSGKLGEIFVRTNQKNSNIGVLFELGIHFVRESSGTEKEMISGWSLLRLYDEQGLPVANKVFEIPVRGGTPEDKGVPLDANTATDEQANIFRTLLLRNKEPRFSVRVMQSSKEQKELLDLLPDTLIGSAAHISLFANFRQILADQLLRDRMDTNSTEPLSDPFLATFPKAAGDTYCMDLMRHSWIEAQKKLSRQQKKDPMALKNTFIKCFMDRVYPILALTDDHRKKQVREQQPMNPVKTPRYLDPLAMLLSPEAEFRPFHTNEISFNVVNQHCLKVS